MPADMQAPPSTRAECVSKRVGVLVVDDQELVHWGFRLVLGRLDWVSRCVAARDAPQAVAVALRYEPHVAIVDIGLTTDSAVRVCQHLGRLEVPPRILLTAARPGVDEVVARAAGATGFASRLGPAKDLAAAVLRVATGEDGFASAAPVAALSEREVEVLRMVAGGQTNREIAACLGISPHTVKEHTRALYRKLEVKNRAHAVRRAFDLGLLLGTDRRGLAA